MVQEATQEKIWGPTHKGSRGASRALTATACPRTGTSGWGLGAARRPHHLRRGGRATGSGVAGHLCHVSRATVYELANKSPSRAEVPLLFIWRTVLTGRVSQIRTLRPL